MSSEWQFDHTAKDMVKRLELGLMEAGVNPNLHEGLIAYILCGRPTGHFLNSVLANDLKQACTRADIPNRTQLFPIVYFLYNWAPADSWGNQEAVMAWIEQKGFLKDHARRLEVAAALG